MKVEKEAEKILKEFSKTLNNVPDLQETHYIIDNKNLTRKDKSTKTPSEKILKNTKTDSDGNIIVEKSSWTN